MNATLSQGNADTMTAQFTLDSHVQYVTSDLWNLDRINQDGLPLDLTYDWGQAGSGVDAYVVDSGMRTTHNEFTGRARCGYSYFGDSCEDTSGHGTLIVETFVFWILQRLIS